MSSLVTLSSHPGNPLAQRPLPRPPQTFTDGSVTVHREVVEPPTKASYRENDVGGKPRLGVWQRWKALRAMIDTSGLDDWMEYDLVEGAADELTTAGSEFGGAMSPVLTAWGPIDIAYVRGPGREEMVTALRSPTLHALAVKALCDLAAKPLKDLSGTIRGLNAERFRVKRMAQTFMNYDAQGIPRDELGAHTLPLNEGGRMTEGDNKYLVDMVVQRYKQAASDAASKIQGVTTASQDFEKAVTSDEVRDLLTGAWPGALLTPSIGFTLKMPWGGRTDFNKNGDKWKIPNQPGWMGSAWAKWITKFTTPISWGLSIWDSYEDASIQVLMEHPDWSEAQINNKVLQETAVRGGTRSAVGTLVSELASMGASAATGALIGGAGGTVVLPVIGTVSGAAVGAVAGLVAGVAANVVMRGSGATSRISYEAQRGADSLFGTDPASFGEFEWAPDPYPYPAPKPAPTPPPVQPPVPPVPPVPPAPPTPPPSSGLPNPYTVKPGDHLTKIAEEYGTSWPKIYEANKHQIKDPDLIYPGQEFTIPVP